MSKSGDAYVVLGGDPIRQYRAIGGNLKGLQGKEGHVVEITGPVGNKESGTASNGNHTPESTTGAAYGTIRAESVKNIADTGS